MRPPVLPFREIHARFATNRTIHLRHDCSGHMHERDAAQIRRRNKSRDISHHTSTYRNQE